MSWGTAIAAGLDIAGGLLGSKGTSRKRERDSAIIASEVALDHSRKAPSAAVEGFRAAGIHPLFGLTGTSGVTAMPSYSTPADSGGPNFAQVGQGIARAATAFTGRAERAIAEKSAQLGLENQELQNQRLRSEIGLMNQPGRGPGLTSAPGMDGQPDSSLARAKQLISQMDTPLGRTQGAFPLHKTAFDEQGNAIRMFNEEDLGDNDIAQIAHLLRYTLPDYAHNFGRKIAKKIRNRSRDYDRSNPYR